MSRRRKAEPTEDTKQSMLVDRIKEQYFTAQEAFQYLGITRDAFNNYVRRDPEGYGKEKLLGRHAYYRKDKIMEIKERTEQFLTPPYRPGDYRKHPVSTFEPASENDMPTIARISTAVFRDERNPTSSPTPIETRLAWLRKNPETYHVLRHQEGHIVGYACILPLRKETIERFIRDEIKTTDITADKIEPFEPNNPIHLYIMSVCVDPACTSVEKHEYGARLIFGLFAFLLNLAERGVEIEAITARSYKLDGIRLLKKVGIPQLRSPVPNKNLFSVCVADSGIPLLVEYSELLEQWRSRHKKNEHANPIERST